MGIKKSDLLPLGVLFNGRPFVNVGKSNFDNTRMDLLFGGRPFYVTPGDDGVTPVTPDLKTALYFLLF